MDEVVVIGYGDFKKVIYMGFVFVLNMDKLELLFVVFVVQMMEVNILGLSLVVSFFQLGFKVIVWVCGIVFMNVFIEFFYVLDGVLVVFRDMSGLSVNVSVGGFGLIEILNFVDIESIIVLKDVVFVLLYGVKGFNGVIFIIIKKGKEGKMRVSMQVIYGIMDIVYNYCLIMGGEECRELIYEGFVNYCLNQGDLEVEVKVYVDG